MYNIFFCQNYIAVSLAYAFFFKQNDKNTMYRILAEGGLI